MFVIPTSREGVGMSTIKIRGTLPLIKSDAHGVVDSAVEGEMVLGCKVDDVEYLNESMATYYNNPKFVQNMAMLEERGLGIVR